jgi:glycosyltransferase involved in cell wall biosynthesis
MKILLVQSAELERFAEALAWVRERWPGAVVTALVDREHEAAIRRGWDGAGLLCYGTGEDGRLEISDETRRRIREERFDLCVMTYHDRMGVRHWQSRLVPIQARIPAIVAINNRGRRRSYGRWTWTASTLFACVVLRMVQPVVRFVRNALDIGMIAGLTLLALPGAGLKAAGLHPLARRGERRPGRPLRLFIFIPSFGLGGAQTVLIDFLRQIDRQKCTVTVCTLVQRDKFFEAAAGQAGFAPVYLDCAPGYPPYWTIIWALARRLAQERPDAAIGWLPWATAFTVVAGSLAGVPRVLQSLHSESPPRRSLPIPVWQRPLEMITARMADRVIACSDASRADYMAWGWIPPGKIVTVRNGIDPGRLRRPTDAELRAVRASLNLTGRPLVGIVGRLSREKDHRMFLEAMRLVRETVPAVAALVIGTGHERRRLEKESERLGLGGVVTFLGARTDVEALMASLDVLVLTSRSEGLPIVLLEGQALGVPVVTTDAGGARETVRDGETGFVVPCGDSGQLAARIVQLLGDERLRRSFGDRARAYVLNGFHADGMAAEILRLCHA